MMIVLPACVAANTTIQPQSKIAASRGIASGDEVSMQYTCFLDNQELAATTVEKVAEDPGIKKSSIFVKPASFGPVTIKAGGEKDCEECEKKKKELQQFEKVIEARLSEAVVGWQIGEKKRIDLSAPERTDVPKTERFIQLAKVRRAPKELRIQREQYVAQNHEQPAVGQKVNSAPPLTGEVISIGKDEVVIRFYPGPEKTIDSPFGKKTAYDRGDYYEIVIDAQVGALVRTGPLVGRIAEVGEKMFTLDYGQPFGGKTLSCEVEANSSPGPAKPILAKEK